MKSQRIIFVFALYTISNVISSPLPGMASGAAYNPECTQIQADGDIFTNMTDICMTKLKLTVTDLPPLDDTFEKNGYQDKCLFKCILVEVGGMTEDGTAKQTELAALSTNSNMSPPMKTKFETLTASCIESSKKQAEGDACKYAAILTMCLAKGEKELCTTPSKKK